MGGRSSSFRHSGGSAGGSIPSLTGSKDEIAQAEKIRKPYATALKNLDQDTLYKGIRTARGETREQQIKAQHVQNPIYYQRVDSVARDLSKIREKHGGTDERRHELVENVKSGKMTLKQARATAQREDKNTRRAIANYFKREGNKLLSHKDASWWIDHKKELNSSNAIE